MANQKVSDLPSLNGADVDAADLLYIVDSSAGSAGSKKITVGQYQLAPVSGGTANGVAYLDASKVLTTGSALVFDGTNLGLGVTPSANAYGSAKTFFVSGDTTYGLLALSEESISASSQYVSLLNNAYPDGAGVYKYKISSQLATSYRQSNGTHAWFTAPSGTAGNAITFTQAMTLDASGNLLVGQTSSGTKNSNSFGLDVSGGGYLTISHINGSASGTRYEYYAYNGAEIGSVTQNGTTAVLFNTTSDRRLKENIVPAPSASDVIDAIEIVSHDWKSAPDEHVTYGVIAQDLALVAPQAVLQGDDGDEIERTWGVDYSKLVPMLIKEIQSLRARVAALESA